MARRTCRPTCQCHSLILRTGGRTATRSDPCPCTEARTRPGRKEHQALARAGRRGGKRAEVRLQQISGKEQQEPTVMVTANLAAGPVSSSRHFAFRRQENWG